MMNRKVLALNLLLIGAIFCAIIKPNLAVSSCWYGAGNQYSKLSCPSTLTGSCMKSELTYQGFTITSKLCSTACTYSGEAVTDSTTGYVTKAWCCSSDNCNFSSTISSNKLLTGFSILVATLVAFFKSN